METDSSNIRLLSMESQKEGITTLYFFEFSNGVDCWAVTRRYSQLRRCHVQLLELFSLSELPYFPPKEPIFQKLSWSKKHSDFLQNREEELKRYVVGLLDRPDLQQALPVQQLLSMPSSSSASFALTQNNDDDELGVAAFSGFRVRLTGEPGGIEVVVRTGSHADVSLRPEWVNLTLRMLTEEEGELIEKDPLRVADSPTHRSQALQSLEEVLDFEDGEALKKYSLPPGSYWEVSARGVTAAGIAGSAASLRVRAPAEKEIANLPISAKETMEKRFSDEVNSICLEDPPEKVIQHGGTPERELEAEKPEAIQQELSGVEVPQPTLDEDHPKEQETSQITANSNLIVQQSHLIQTGVEIALEKEVPREVLETGVTEVLEQQLSGVGQPHKEFDGNPGEELGIRQEADNRNPAIAEPFSAENALETTLPIEVLETEVAEVPEQEPSGFEQPCDELEGNPGQDPEINQEADNRSLAVAAPSSGEAALATELPREVLETDVAEVSGQKQSGVAQPHNELEENPGESPVKAAVGAEMMERESAEQRSEKIAPEDELTGEEQIRHRVATDPKVQEKQDEQPATRGRSETAPELHDAEQRRQFAPRRRLGTGAEDHMVLSARGQIAAAYMQNVQAKQQMAIEKAPHRFEKVNGAASSVPLKFSTIGAEKLSQREEAEVLDQKRHEHEMRELQTNERKVARWIYAVTGHPDIGAAVTGKLTIQAAMQSGEALCDLINAVWPGRIVGILRGEVRPLRRVENTEKFCKACREVGVDDVSLCAPAELAVGKEDVRSILHCLFALNAVLPDEYDGPRLGDDLDSPPVSEFNDD